MHCARDHLIEQASEGRGQDADGSGDKNGAVPGGPMFTDALDGGGQRVTQKRVSVALRNDLFEARDRHPLVSA